jgi:hypothetical protein
MSRGHSSEHEAMLAEFLAAADGAPPEAIAGCPECQELLADLRQVATAVTAAARQEHELLADVERMDPAAATQAARRFAAQHLQGPPPAQPRRPWGTWTGLLLAAAAVVAVLLWPRGAPEDPARRTGPVLLGSAGDLRLDHPVGPVTRYAPFTWQAVEGIGVVYQLSIWKDGADRGDKPILTLPLETTTWDPEATGQALPDRIRWQVKATDLARTFERLGSASSSLTPR